MLQGNGNSRNIHSEKNAKHNSVSDYKYLGVTIQTSVKCFTKHITENVAQAIMTIHYINHIRQLSQTSMEIFRAKIMPILTYVIEINWSHFTGKNLEALERVKAVYMKKAIGVSKTSSSRPVYLLAGESYVIEDMELQMLPPYTPKVSETVLAVMVKKREVIHPEFYTYHRGHD